MPTFAFRLSGLFLLSFIFVMSCAERNTSDAQFMIAPTLAHAWTADCVFASPESAIYDEARNVIYVSNVNGYTTNGLGYLSALSIDGEVIDAKWLEGLNAPTGMAIDGDTLYVADFNRVAEIDIPTRVIRRFYEAPDDNPGVNDLTLSPDGALFVSASTVNAIYRLKNDRLVRWLQSEELQYANGLYADATNLYVAGFYLRRIVRQTKMIEPFGDDRLLSDLESIEPAPDGGYFVTQIGDRPIMHVSAQEKISTVLERTTFTADIEVIPSLNVLIAASGGNRVTAFHIN